MKLQEVEQGLVTALHPGNAHKQDYLLQKINSSERMSSVQRLQIYQQSVSAVQQRVLAMVFPVCRQILGDVCFEQICMDYCWADISNAEDLNCYGKSFPVYLRDLTGSITTLQDFAYLGDLAMLEWYWHQANYLKDDNGFDLRDFTSAIQAYETTVPVLSNSMVCLTSKWPVYAVWLAHVDEEQSNINPVESEQRHYYIIHRQGSVKIDSVSEGVYMFFQWATRKETLLSIANKLADCAEGVFAQLPGMISRGWITGFETQLSSNDSNVN